MKNLIRWVAWDKEAMDEAAGRMEQWRVEVTADINQLNNKVDMLLKRLAMLVPPATPMVTILKSVEEGRRKGEIIDLPYVLL